MPAAAERADGHAFPAELETERLRLRPFGDDDAGWYAAMNADPDVVRYLGDGSPYGRKQSDESLHSIRGHWDEFGFGLWAAERTDTDEPIGFVGLAVPTFLPELLPAVEIGWRLARRHWGLGLATEGARAGVEQGFDALGLDRIVSITVHDNLRSQRVMSRLGLSWHRACVHPRFGLVVQVRSITAQRWSAAASGPA